MGSPASVFYAKQYQTTGTQQDLWESRVRGLIGGAQVFFRRDTQIMTESACEPRRNCNVDQRSFKAYLGRWMAATTKVAPWTHDDIMPLLQTSAQAAADTCTGGDNGQMCGMRWWQGAYDGSTGVGEQMSALEVIQSNLIDSVPGPVSQGSGGISKGDPSAGTGGDGPTYERITTGDRAGAGILTALMVVIILGGTWWLVRS
jgi:mannan endo-1,6-alpha-mannosidase